MESKRVYSEYDTLVLSGGSSKSLLIIGALQCLYDEKQIQEVNNYVGTSAGSMLGFLLAIGYTPVEIMVYLCTHQLLEKLQSFDIVAMIQGRGASSFNTIQETLEKMTIDKLGYLPSLQDIHDKLGKTLVCVTHNLTEDRTEYLSYKNYPHLPAVVAVKMSSNLPLIFENYKYGSSFYTDGGLSDNFAIATGEKYGKKVLGICLGKDSVEFDPDMKILEFIYTLMFTPIKQTTANQIKNARQNTDIVQLIYKSMKVFNFNIPSKEKLDMFSAGYNQMHEWKKPEE